MYGQNNTGPATEVWHEGDRVRHLGDDAVGIVGRPQRPRGAFEAAHVWVRWDDGRRYVVGDYEYRGCFVDPNSLDRA